MAQLQCDKCGEMVDEAKAFCPGCGHAFVEEEKRKEASGFEKMDNTVQLGQTMYNQMLSEMGLNISKTPETPVRVESIQPASPTESPKRTETVAPAAAAPKAAKPETRDTIAVSTTNTATPLWLAVAITLLGSAVVLGVALLLHTFVIWPRLGRSPFGP